MTFIYYILILMIAAEIGIQIAYQGVIFQRLKIALGLVNDKYRKLSSLGFWKKFFGKHLWYMFSIVLPIMLIKFIHSYLIELLNCPYCVAFWTSLAILSTIGINITVAALASILGMTMVKIIESINQ